MKVQDLIIDAQASIGKKTLLVEVIPCYQYKDGKRTDVIEAYRYVVALPEKAFEKLGVKISGNQLMDVTEQGYEDVQFDGLELHLYWQQGTYEMAATATGIHKVKNS